MVACATWGPVLGRLPKVAVGVGGVALNPHAIMANPRRTAAIRILLFMPGLSWYELNSVNHRFAVVTASAVGNCLFPGENATKVATTMYKIFESVIY
jgi:hypothetical protein